MHTQRLCLTLCCVVRIPESGKHHGLKFIGSRFSTWGGPVSTCQPVAWAFSLYQHRVVQGERKSEGPNPPMRTKPSGSVTSQVSCLAVPLQWQLHFNMSFAGDKRSIYSSLLSNKSLFLIVKITCWQQVST